MKFKIITGYYDRRDDKTIPCRILAVRNSDKWEFDHGTFAAVEYGNVNSGVFYPLGGEWLISKLDDKLGCTREPRNGEERLNLCVHNRNAADLKKCNDDLGRLHFRLEGDVVMIYDSGSQNWKPFKTIA